MEITDFMVSQITNLCGIPSPSGYTQRVRKYLIQAFENLGFTPAVTNKGSVLVNLGGSGDALVLAAHVDTLGLMVRSIKDNGRLRFTHIGGFPDNYIETENCTVLTRTEKEYSATVQLVNPAVHYRRDINEIKRDDTNMEIVLDEKVKNKDDVRNLGISPGDFIALDPRTVYTTSGYLKSRHLDDKASSGVLVALAKMVKDGSVRLERNVWLLFTTYEEVGHGACAGLPEGVAEILSVDMGVVGEDLDTSEHTVSICAKDSGGPYDYDVTTKLISLAKSLGLNYAVDIYPQYGSDAGAALHAGYDLKHGLVGPGVSASHGYERTHREGLENTLKLLAAYISGKNGA